MVGTALGTKGRNPMNSSKYKRDRGSHVRKGDRRREEEKHTERGKEKRNLTEENKKTKR